MTILLRSCSIALALGAVTALSAQAQNPRAKPDESWVSLSGIVASAQADSFMLDYGSGLITVEMDDWDWYGDAYGLLEGDDVTVYGRVDDGLFENTTIEASSVYVEDLNSYFYANPADEEGDYPYTYAYATLPVVTAGIDYTGMVESVDGREFTLDTGSREVRVDTADMTYNPMDNQGYQKIEQGDVVRVSGVLDDDLFESRELMASSIITLVEDTGRSDNY